MKLLLLPPQQPLTIVKLSWYILKRPLILHNRIYQPWEETDLKDFNIVDELAKKQLNRDLVNLWAESNHKEPGMIESSRQNLARSLMPVYCFSTIYVVGIFLPWLINHLTENDLYRNLISMVGLALSLIVAYLSRWSVTLFLSGRAYGRADDKFVEDFNQLFRTMFSYLNEIDQMMLNRNMSRHELGNCIEQTLREIAFKELEARPKVMFMAMATKEWPAEAELRYHDFQLNSFYELATKNFGYLKPKEEARAWAEKEYYREYGVSPIVLNRDSFRHYSNAMNMPE